MPSSMQENFVELNASSAAKESVETSYSIDRFHNGSFEVAQPTSGGHRAGMDALLLAATLKDGASGLVADLGAGSGVAGFAALNLHRELDLLAVELNETMFDMLSKTLSRALNARFANRTTTLLADVTLSGTDRLEQGFADNSVDHVIMNPPYNTYSYRPPAKAIKHDAHMLGEGGLDAWFRTAAAITRIGGSLNMIYRSEDIAAVIACSRGRYGGLQIIPIHSKKNENAKRILVCGIRGSKAPLTILPGFVVHNDDGTFSEHADAIFKGKMRLLD